MSKEAIFRPDFTRGFHGTVSPLGSPKVSALTGKDKERVVVFYDGKKFLGFADQGMLEALLRAVKGEPPYPGMEPVP